MNRSCVNAFTLVELLIVVGIVALLVAILLPAVAGAREHGYSTVCQGNLHALHTALNATSSDAPLEMPTAWQWLTHVRTRGAGGALVCPKVGSTGQDASDPLDDVYIDHFHLLTDHLYVYVKEALAPGAPLGTGVFDQVSVNRGAGYDEITIFGGGTLRITYGDPIVLEGLPSPTFPTWTGSNQHLYMGNQMLMNLMGKDNLIAPKLPDGSTPAIVTLGKATLSYGMNNQVPSMPAKPTQLLLVEYNKNVADVDNAGNNDDVLDKTLQLRHLNKANTLFVDGSVRPMGRAELDKAEPLWKP